MTTVLRAAGPTTLGRRGRRRIVFATAVAISIALIGLAAVRLGSLTPAPVPIRIGAVFPLSGSTAALAGPELAGVRIAVDLANADGGVAGHRIELDVRDLESRSDSDAVMADFKAHGIELVIGAYSSELSIAASQAADRAGLLYWEAGAVADQVTGRGLPLVFRVGASGANLGAGSATFAASELASRLGKDVSALRVAVVNADDAYARSVADAAVSTATERSMQIVLRTTYNLSVPDWPRVMAQLSAARPDVIILASHIPDGVAFRRAMVAAGVRTGALIGSTMAECDPDFAGDLGSEAIGIFASDRPTAGFRPEALSPKASLAYDRFSDAWARERTTAGAALASADPTGSPSLGRYGTGGGYLATDGYAISGPAESGSADADEEALAGFSAAWALVHHVLPAALTASGSATSGGDRPGAAAVAAAARLVDLPEGALPNGAGLRFSSDNATLGQNERAAAVIWQWQAVRRYAFVWPASYATGEIGFVPLVQ